jgi:serine/threonine protein kinase
MPAVTSLYCPSCNNPISPGTKFCASCGHQLEAADDTAKDRLIGQFIGGRYRVEAKLGEGGMGAVYRAEQVAMKRKIALKVLHPHLSADQQLIERFHREAAASSKLSHPNTITVHDFGQTSDGTLYIAMEFIEGKSLADVIEETGAVHWTRAVRIGLQVAESLADAHEQGIVHRDLKPDNIMLISRAGQADFAKILDFGIAKMAEAAEGDAGDKRKALTKTGMIFGTPQYMSPEQVRGAGVDHRTDIYALGIILYQLIAGELPFRADNPMGMLTKHLMEPPRPLGQTRPGVECPSMLESLIMMCLEKDQDRRYQSMNMIVRELSSLVNETRPGFAVQMSAPPSGVPSGLTTDAGHSAGQSGSSPGFGGDHFTRQGQTGGFVGQPSSGGFVGQPSSGGFVGQPSSGGFVGQPSSGGVMAGSARASAGSKSAGRAIVIGVVVILLLATIGVGGALAWRAISSDDDDSPPPVDPSTLATTAPTSPEPPTPMPPTAPPIVPSAPTPPTITPPASPSAIPSVSSGTSPSKISPCLVEAAGGAKANKASQALADTLSPRETQFGLCFASILNKSFEGNIKLSYRWGRGKGPNKIKATKADNEINDSSVRVCIETVLKGTPHPNQAKRGGRGVLELAAKGGGGALESCKIVARVPVASKGPKPPGWTPTPGYYPNYGGYGGY